MKLNKLCLLAISGFISFSAVSQEDDLLKMLDNSQPKEKIYTSATFKTTRITNMQSVEVLGRRSLDFRIMHRFGDFSSGAYNAWGIDGPANIKLSLEYSHDGRFMFGLGRSSVQKMIDGFLKYKLLRQTTDNKMPISLTLFSSAYYTRMKATDTRYNDELHRLSYCNQIIIARKMNSWLSMQIAPTMVHYNLVEKSSDVNDMYAICGAMRVKIKARQAITFEYGYVLNTYTDNQHSQYKNTMGIAWEVETGGHVFQMHLTNSMGINESQFIPYTTSAWGKGQIRLGFNISRVFSTAKRS